MTLRSSIVPLLAALLAAAPAAAQDGLPRVERVAAMLTGFEDVPSIEAWRAMGPEVVPVLARIAGDDQQPGFVRLRAIQAAGAFATRASRALLRRAIRGADPMMAREAALAMARAFGHGSIGDVAPLLAHHDTAVREGAIRALASIDGELARRRLRARLPHERDPVLRDQIARVLSGGVGAARDG